MLKFFNRKPNTPGKKPNAKAQMAQEATILAVIWGLLIIAFLFADYRHSPKLQRYQLELASYTAGVTKPTLLKTTCGEDVISTLYEHRMDSNFKPIQACQTANASPATLITSANQQFNQIQNALAQTWREQSREQRGTELVKNETGVELGSDKLTSRQDWLNLNDRGQLDSVNQLMALTAGQAVSSNNASATASADSPSVSPTATAATTLTMANIDQNTLAMSLLAVADGNRRFPYNRLFDSNPALARLLNQAASDIASVYEANNNQAKAQQASQLLPLIGNPKNLGMLTQVAIWSWVTLGLLWLSRLRHPLQVLAMAMTAWGLVIAGVSHEVILSMKVGLGIFCLGILLTVLSLFGPAQALLKRLPDNRELGASPWIYPLFVGFVTFGLMILFDLSTRSYLSLRYIFLNHFKDLFWCFVLVSLARPLASIVSMGLQRLVATNVMHAYWGNVAGQVKKARGWLIAFALGYLGLAVMIHSDSAKVAELSKIWLMAFLAIFLAINQRSLIQQLFFRSKKMTLLLMFAVLLPFIALGIANEKGTMMVFLFMFTFLVGVALSNKIFQMGGRGYITGVLSSTAILLLLMMGLVNLSGFDDRTAERVSTWMNPFIATNDQMAILHWFRESVPMVGYGFGDIPWCGYHLSGCQGVPLQMQSDYTITSVMAVIGIVPTVILMVIYFGWLVLIANKQMAYANEQMKSRLLSGGYHLLAWVILLWVVITIFQALVTISGNLGMLPLTGVTLPFLSYGTSNLWLNGVMLSLALFQPKLMLDKVQK